MRAAGTARSRPFLSLFLSAVALLMACPVFAASGYSLHALPEAPGDVASDAYGVSVEHSGGGGAIWVAGRSSSPGGVHRPVVWNASADLGASSVTPLGTLSPGVSSEAHAIRCADGSCRAVGNEGPEGAGRAPVLWSYGGSWGPPVALSCPAQAQPASPDVGVARGVALTIQGSNFGNTACGACDVTQGAVGAVQHAVAWEEQPGGAWTPVPLPGLSSLTERSSEATAIFHIPAATGARLVAAGWAEDDLGTRQPVLWERFAAGWSVMPLPLPPGSRGGEVQAGDFGEAGHAFVLDGSRSQDDGVVNSYHWRQVSGPFGTPPAWEGRDLPPLPGYDGSAARAVAGRRGVSRAQTHSASFNVIGSSSSSGGLPPRTTLWEVYPLTVETHDFELTVRDRFGNLAGMDIRSSTRGPSSGVQSGARVSVGTARTFGPPASGAGTEGLAEENHAVALVQLEPAPGLMPIGLIAALVSLATIGAAILAMRRGEAHA